MGLAPQQQDFDSNRVWISQPDGATNVCSDPEGRFTIAGKDQSNPCRYLHTDAYSAAMAFVEGKVEVRGDIFEAVRYFSQAPHAVLRRLFFSGRARLQHLRTSLLLGYRKAAARNIQFHYDRSNEFYSQFLDSRMIYSAAHFSRPDDSLEEAQRQKLEAICRDLEL